MNSDTQSAREDLAFLRSLVDEDWRPGTWAFGALYVSIGVALVAHVLISWAADAGHLPLRGVGLLATYVVLYSVAGAVWTRIGAHIRRESQSRGTQVASVKSRAGGAVLVSAFVGHLVMLGVFVIVAVRQKNPVFLELAPMVLFTLQSVVWFVVHAMRQQRWQLVVGLGWLLAVLALAPLVGTSVFGLGIGATAVVLMIVPGAYLMHMAGKR
jgi:hypothetical protein